MGPGFAVPPFVAIAVVAACVSLASAAFVADASALFAAFGHHWLYAVPASDVPAPAAAATSAAPDPASAAVSAVAAGTSGLTSDFRCSEHQAAQ